MDDPNAGKICLFWQVVTYAGDGEERFSIPFKSHQIGDHLLQMAEASSVICGLRIRFFLFNFFDLSGNTDFEIWSNPKTTLFGLSRPRGNSSA